MVEIREDKRSKRKLDMGDPTMVQIITDWV